MNPQDEVSEKGTSFLNCMDRKTYCYSRKLHIYVHGNLTPRSLTLLVMDEECAHMALKCQLFINPCRGTG